MVTKKKHEPAPVKNEPRDVARAMRMEAVRNTGKVPTFRIYNGWRFGLSYGPVPTPDRAMWERLKELPGGIAAVLQRFGLKTPTNLDELTYEAFRAHLDATRDAVKIALTNEWILSASLHPRGRTSVEKDWRFYGEMMAAFGAPIGALMTPIETTDPNAVHYTIWNEDAAAVDPAKVN